MQYKTLVLKLEFYLLDSRNPLLSFVLLMFYSAHETKCVHNFKCLYSCDK